MERKVQPTSRYAPQKRHNNSEDRINRICELSNDVLVFILSRLTMREAARTCILSRRWEKLWTFTTGSLDFDGTTMMHKALLERRNMVRRTERLAFVSWVNQVLELHHGRTIDEFKVRFDLDSKYAYAIYSWINFAMEKRVQRLELDLSNCWRVTQSGCYSFPHTGYTAMDMDSESRVAQDLGFHGFYYLTALHFRSVNITGKVLELFLCNCPYLERLCVPGSRSLVSINVAGSSLKLKYLEICHCFYLENLEISAINLVKFKYFGPKLCMPFKNVPSLVDVSIGGDYCKSLIRNFFQLSSYLPQLETLTLNLSFEVQLRFPEQFPEFINLKHLELIVAEYHGQGFLSWTPLIESSPLLCGLKLQVLHTEPSTEREVRKAAKRPHQCLKVVEIVGFVGLTTDVELVMYLLENTTSLEKIIIDPREPCLEGSPWEFRETEEKQAARERARQLETELPTRTELVIL